MTRERWGSKLGVILAVAGSAVGLGNFLRFPAIAAENGGGAFMIPYFVCFFLLGLPLMWIEWTIGRFGGGFEHSTAPGIFHTMWQKNRFIKYFGVIGIFGPTVIFIYYTYIESWLLGYSWFALTGKYLSCTDQAGMQEFLKGYQGLAVNEHFGGIGTAYLFFLVTFILNTVVVCVGIRGGIERVCKWGLLVLFVMAIVIAVRVLTLGTPDASKPGWNPIAGLGFLWNPQWDKLRDPGVWLAAAGQIFFTLSAGFGVILTYASYLTKQDDVALSGLTAATTNEVAEVILGGSIMIPAAFAFIGPEQMQAIVGKGLFDLGFVTMPLIFEKIGIGGQYFAFMWFFLLFLAGLTSSISLALPAIAFMEDEFNLTRREAGIVFAVVTFALTQPVIFFLGHGVLDEMDFWGTSVSLVVFATIEAIMFGWVFGMDKAWEELHVGSDIRIPRVYRFIIKYVTPAFLITILTVWLLKDRKAQVFMTNVPPQNRVFVMMTRIGLLALLVFLLLMIWIVWRHRRREGEEGKA
ncbi:MAG: sodium-dependent transporter [Planctomycetaceae bacterium]|nr:sodium-dependent transporter [Planctomycetaceae bacterium]